MQAKMIDPKDLFRQAQKGDVEANVEIGHNFNHGYEGFPIDMIQAKKHYLRALLKSDPMRAWTLGLIIRIDEGKGGFFSLGKAIMMAKDKVDSDKDSMLRFELQAMLEDIEKRYGIFSPYESELCSPRSLKDISTKYIVENFSIFKVENVKQLPIPVELQDDLQTEQNHALNRPRI